MEIEKLIEKLRDAGWTNPGLTDKQSLEWDAATALERLQAENDRLKEEVQQMRWTPVEERLPEPTENPVLAFDCTGPVMAWYSPTMGWMYRTGIAGCGITHWMHLPQPPKEETHEK